MILLTQYTLLFASVLLGKRLNGDSMEEAVRFSSDYVSRVIAHSCRIPTPHREGIALEDCLWELVKKPQDISL